MRKNHGKKPQMKERFQVRRLKASTLTGLGVQDFIAESDFICNELTMDRAMAVADTQAKIGNACIIIPFYVVCPA